MAMGQKFCDNQEIDALERAAAREAVDPATNGRRKRGQRGRAKATLDLIETCREIIEQTKPISIRGVCYRLLAAGAIDSMEKGNTQKVSRVLVGARERGEIPWQWIVDDTREILGFGECLDLEQYADRIERQYRRDFWAHQPRMVVLVSEKSTVMGILNPVLAHYGITHLSAHGFNSATAIYDLAGWADGDRPHHFLYVGDHDPSGMFMSEVDLPERLRRYGAEDFHIERIALTAEDLPSLPSFAAKKTDSRYDWYRKRYGRRAWELDALDPNDLRDRVARAIARYIDPVDWERHNLVEAAQRETVRTIAQRLAAEFDPGA